MLYEPVFFHANIFQPIADKLLNLEYPVYNHMFVKFCRKKQVDAVKHKFISFLFHLNNHKLRKDNLFQKISLLFF